MRESSLTTSYGGFQEQVERRRSSEVAPPVFRPIRRRLEAPPLPEAPPRDLVFYNGTGGFSRDGREYIITLKDGQTTPAPWVNVIANAGFGTVVSEAGSVYTWSENSPRIPAHSLEQRPGDGCQRRGVLHP